MGASNVQDVGIRIRADGVAETTAGVKLTAQSIKDIGSASREATNETRSMAQQQRQAAADAERLIRSLQEEADSLGKTRLQMKAYQLDQMQLTASQREAARDAIERIRRYGEEEAALSRVLATSRAMGTTIAMGAAAVGGYLVYQAGKAINAAAEMATLSEKTGIAVEQLSTMKYAADLSETSMEALARSMQQLPKALVEAQNPNSAAGRGFAFLGIDPKELKTQQEAIDAIADAITRVQDPMAKSAALQLIFKRNGDELISFFNNGSEGLRQLTEEGRQWAEISGVTAARAKELKDQMVTLGYGVDTLGRQLADQALGPLNNWVQQLILARKETGGFVSALALLATQTPFASNTLAQIRGYQKDIADQERLRQVALDNGNKPYAATFGANIATLRKRLEIAKLVQRQAVEDEYRGQDLMDGKDRRLAAAGAAKIKGMPDAAGGGGTGRTVSDYEKLRRAALEMAASANEEATATERLTASDRALVKMRADLEAGTLKLTQSQQAQITALLQASSATEHANLVENERRRLQSANDAAYERQIETIGAAAERDREASEALRRHNEEIGLSAEALRELRVRRADLRVAELEAQAAEAAAEPGREREYQLLLRRIEALREQAKLVREGADRENKADQDRKDKQEKDKQEREAERAKEKSEAEQKRKAEALEREITSGLMRAFERGEGAGKAFFDTLKNIAKTTILQPMLKPITEPLAKAAGQIGEGISGWINSQIGGLLGGGFGGGLGGLFGGGGGGATGGFDPIMTLTQVAHSGGVAGSSALATRSVPASVFHGARRMHSGGLAGDEVPTILQRGEEVLTRGDPRHVANGGGSTVISMPFSPVIQAPGATAGTVGQIRAMMREEMPGLLYDHRRTVVAVLDRHQKEMGARARRSA